ncbi:MAG TPA: hypothetical protein VNV85_00610 [Puia sp.]|jgi:hypothetical protein|nr:hypothetical protein [Puia sp.]
MKKSICINTLAVMLFFFSMLACRKTLESKTQSVSNNATHDSSNTNAAHDSASTNSIAPYPQMATTQCSGGPDYGDSILYTQPSQGDYIVKPINNPASGQYFAWPVGMNINKYTGAIDITRSETGLRYNIGYVKDGTTDTCLQTMILAGASYADSIYVLANSEQNAFPYFNANPNLMSICNGGGITGGITCMFDVTGQATSQKIAIDKNTGVIDLRKTLNQGAFNTLGLLTLNGTTIQTTISYKLNDGSNMAMQQIPVTLIYYNRKADVPPSLVAYIENTLNKILNDLLLINLLGTTGANRNGNPRPPIIVVTRTN